MVINKIVWLKNEYHGMITSFTIWISLFQNFGWKGVFTSQQLEWLIDWQPEYNCFRQQKTRSNLLSLFTIWNLTHSSDYPAVLRMDLIITVQVKNKSKWRIECKWRKESMWIIESKWRIESWNVRCEDECIWKEESSCEVKNRVQVKNRLPYLNRFPYLDYSLIEE